MRKKVLISDYFGIVYFVYLILNLQFAPYGSIDGNAILRIGILVVLYYLSEGIVNRQLVLYSIICIGLLNGITGVLQICGFLPSQSHDFAITGFMGNPGPFGCMSAMTFIAISAVVFSKTQNRTLWGCALIFMGFCLAVSESRASWLATMAGLTVILVKRIPSGNRFMRTIVFLFFTLVVAGLYFYRPLSALGRLLIWSVCFDIFTDYPIFGIGAGGFGKCYMLYQSKYFMSNPDSFFSPVADNVAYPYNEFLHILVEQGLLGFILFALILAFGCRLLSKSYKSLIVTFLVFACFSYPFYIPVLTCLFVAVLGQQKDIPRKTLFKGQSFLYLCIIAGLCLLMSYTGKRVSDDGTVSNISCELWVEKGIVAMREGNMDEAEIYFTEASYMIPTRIVPKYQLWRLYILKKEFAKAENMADVILSQPVKIENTRTVKIKKEIREYYE